MFEMFNLARACPQLRASETFENSQGAISSCSGTRHKCMHFKIHIGWQSVFVPLFWRVLRGTAFQK